VPQALAAEGLDSVIVRAEKREAPIHEVPIAMSALSSEQLNDAGITNADGLATELPSLDLQRNTGLTTTSLRIRRLGNIGNIPTFEPAVGVYVDGAYRSRSFLATSNLVAVDQVEILRGPQTALYGKNVSAGLISIYTRKSAQSLTARFELTQGWIDSPTAASLHNFTVDLSGPITTHLTGGIAGQIALHDHTLKNALPHGRDGNDKRQSAWRTQLVWSPNDASELRLLSGYMRSHDDEGESDVYFAPGAASTQVSSFLQQQGLTPGCSDNVPRNLTSCSVATNRMEVESTDVTLLGERRSGNGLKLSSMTSWDRYEIFRTDDDAIQLFAPLLFYRDAERGRSIQQELRLESPSNTPLTWLLGGFYYNNDYERGDHGRKPMFGANGDLAYHPVWSATIGLPLAVPGQLGIHDSQLETNYRSVFGQASWHFTPRFMLTSSLRWQQEDKHATINNSVTAPGISLISAILAPSTTLDGRPVNGSLGRKSENVAWSLTPQIMLGDGGNLYVTAARGAKSGGFNTGFGDTALADRTFADEDIHTYEAGAKLLSSERRAFLSAAAFYSRYDNYQDSAFIAAQFAVNNAERVSLQGMELDASLLFNRNLSMDLSVSYADLRYDLYTRGLCYPGRTANGSAPGTCDLSGSHPIQAPEWEAHANVQYQHPLAWGEMYARLGWSWSDTYNTSFSADPRLTQKPRNDVSLRVGLRMGHPYELVFWAANLLDENVVYFDSLLNLFNDESYQTYSALPRSYGISVRMRL
jgi:iron complex outermembrane recepter protein